MEDALSDDEERECTFTLKKQGGEWKWDLVLPLEAELHRVMEMAWTYGYHIKQCAVLAVLSEMTNATPEASMCSCGWQAFADKLKEKLGK